MMMIETRGLCKSFGNHVVLDGNSAVLAVAWCCFLSLVGYFWARAVYNRNP